MALLLTSWFVADCHVVFAQNIDPRNAHAYAENVGWLNASGVQVGATGLTGYMWGENIGWVSLSCENTANCGTVPYGVANDGAGHLSGFAWSENVGWINFAPVGSGVTIDGDGIFQGMAWGENIGWINFHSSGPVPFSVKTSWCAAADLYPPVSAVSGVTTAWSKTDVNAVLSAADNSCGVGVREVRYSLDNSPPAIVPGSSVTVLVASEGTHTLAWYSVDNAGNVETVQSRIIQIDKTPPAISFTSPAHGAVYDVGAQVRASYSAADAVSGLVSVTGSSSGGFTLLPNGSLIGTLTVGTYTATVTAVDAAGHTATISHTYTVANPAPAGIILKVTSDGVPTGNYGEDGPAANAQLNVSSGLAVDRAGNIYVCDNGHSVIRRIDGLSRIITTVAGTGTPGYSGDGQAATSAAIDLRFEGYGGLAFDAQGSLYIADTGNNRIRKVDATTGFITTVAGNGNQGFAGDGGPATGAQLARPGGVAVDAAGNLYIADSGNHRVRRVDGATGSISTYAGGSTTNWAGDGGPAINGGLNYPRRVALDNSGNLYIADSLHGAIRRVDAVTKVITSVAGGGIAGVNLGGEANDVAADAYGRLYIAGPFLLWKLEGGAGSVVSGTGGSCFFDTPGGAYATFCFAGLHGVAVAPAGDLHVTSRYVYRLVGAAAPPAGIAITCSTTQFTLDSITNPAGSVSMVNDACRTTLSLPNFTAAGGDFTVTGNAALTSLSTPLLSSVVGSVDVSGNGSTTNVTIGGTTTPTTIGGNFTVETSTCSAGQTANFSNVTATGNVDLTANCATTLSAATGGGTTTVTLVNTEATMQALLPTGWTAGAVPFSVTHQNPANLPTEPGVSFTNTVVDVDPVAAYSFNFAIPTLNSDATLVFEIKVAALDAATQTALLDALASGSATLAVKGDAPGSQYQTFAVCSGSAVPTAGGCVSVATLDAAGNPTTGTPATVRFTGIVGHFSTWAVVVVTPAADASAPAISCAAADGLWHNANVTIACTASDFGSGLANVADASFTLATSVADGQENSNSATGSRSVCDAAGNCATAGPIAGNRIDRKPPVIAISSPAATSYTFAQAVNAAFTCTDGGAGTASCAGTSPNGSVINTASVGTKTFTVSASDAAGNAATVSVNYTVSPLPISATVVLAPASPQYSDRTTVTVTLPIVAGLPPATSMTVTAGGQSPGPVSFSASGSTITATTTLEPLLVAPGSYPLSITFGGVNPNFALPAYSSSLAIGKEDARATYSGTLFAATSSTSSNAATVVLSATIQDMTAVDPSDSNPGDVRNAKVTFVNRDTTPPTVLCANLPVGLVDAADLKTGTATCSWSANIGSADSDSFTIGIVVDGHYTRNDSNDNAVVTVSRPYPSSFITGGGYLVLARSAGLTAGDVNSRANFGFNVKFNKSGTNLQGRINTIVRRQGRVYQIKGNSMTSLASQPATVGGKATFTGKASITDITDPLAPLAVDGNATLQVTMSDKGEPGNTDAIGLTVWNKSGGLWFSSNWTGTATVEQVLAGGNLVVR